MLRWWAVSFKYLWTKWWLKKEANFRDQTCNSSSTIFKLLEIVVNFTFGWFLFHDGKHWEHLSVLYLQWENKEHIQDFPVAVTHRSPRSLCASNMCNGLGTQSSASSSASWPSLRTLRLCWRLNFRAFRLKQWKDWVRMTESLGTVTFYSPELLAPLMEKKEQKEYIKWTTHAMADRFGLNILYMDIELFYFNISFKLHSTIFWFQIFGTPTIPPQWEYYRPDCALKPTYIYYQKNQASFMLKAFGFPQGDTSYLCPSKIGQSTVLPLRREDAITFN